MKRLWRRDVTHAKILEILDSVCCFGGKRATTDTIIYNKAKENILEDNNKKLICSNFALLCVMVSFVASLPQNQQTCTKAEVRCWKTFGVVTEAFSAACTGVLGSIPSDCWLFTFFSFTSKWYTSLQLFTADVEARFWKASTKLFYSNCMLSSRSSLDSCFDCTYYQFWP